VREKSLWWTVLALALVIGVWTTVDAWRCVGRPYPGFSMLDNLLVGLGVEHGKLKPFDFVRAMDGRVLASGSEMQAEVRRHPPGTMFHYVVYRRGSLVEADIASKVEAVRDFWRFLLEGLLPGLLFLGLGAAVLVLKPGAPEVRVFLLFCLIWFVTATLYRDAVSTYRFDALFLTAWAFSPALYLHLALSFPEPRPWTLRHPRVISAVRRVAYGASALLALLLQTGKTGVPPSELVLVPTVSAVYWLSSLVVLMAALALTAFRGSSALGRQRARVLLAGFAVGQLAPVFGSTFEAVTGTTVPYLNELWRLNLFFPIAVAYAMVRYDLFDVRAVVRMGTIYGLVTGIVIAAYAGAITLLNVIFTRLGMGSSPFATAVVLALAVVLFLNPVYVRAQRVVDRLFFRQRLDVQRSLERLAGTMTTMLDLDRIAGLISRTVDESFHPSRLTLALLDEGLGRYRVVVGSAGPMGAGGLIAAESSLARHLAAYRQPLTRVQHEADPDQASCRDACLPQMRALGAELVMPVLFGDRVTGFLGLGEKRSGASYTTDDLRLLRVLVNQSAVALENARAYTALEEANRRLGDTLRRVEILESIRTSLSKFVPRRVQELIEQAPEAPEFAKREMDVSVLFVDIAGYTRLSERHDPDRLNIVVERYFGAFLDEVLRNGGDVNETAGDGLMVIFQDEDSERHARNAAQAALGILRRADEINGEAGAVDEPIRLHVGVNSGAAAVGATKIEGTAGTRWTYTASGPVTNVAARLAALGAGDSVFIGPETARRLSGWLDLEDLGERELRNVEERVRVFRLVAGSASLAA
jgi:class 3 adenylate cyclase